MEEKKTFEGIFEIVPVKDDYARIIKKVAEGIVTDIRDKELKYTSTTIFGEHAKTMSGSTIGIKNERGEGDIEFPRQFSLSDRREIIDQKVRYADRIWSSPSEGTFHDYTLEILEGSFRGERLESKAFA